jgi:GR25 family glycosyltransferase involved in LPS biosynthesis
MAETPVFYLNLERRKDRNENCIKEFTKAGFTNVTRIEALDANTYRPSPKEMSYFSKCDFMHLGKTAYRIMCNMLGHMKMWQKVLENNLDYAIICQDDVYFTENVVMHLSDILNNLPEDAGIVNLGLHKFAAHSVFVAYDLKNDSNPQIFSKKVNEYVGIIKKHTVNPCSLCYIITKKGAKELLEHTEKQGVLRATDGHINDYYYNMNKYYGSLRVLATGDPSFGSDIFC